MPRAFENVVGLKDDEMIFEPFSLVLLNLKSNSIARLAKHNMPENLQYCNSDLSDWRQSLGIDVVTLVILPSSGSILLKILRISDIQYFMKQ
ncbi:hypothetical protein WICMUC_003452 [Wickerhamomyces mucosus]|uniref:Uncharacterized protein n=1 Tax=Wickerhamomyces mucosus TaxID=1378264 RepID=A0A9P8TD72_9ASCO|nr:hypothetical protein WICMUC_003452 [Wickerhamomyces mucosus]